MRYYFAPMEGLTDYIFRGIHHRFFPGVDRYYTPFLSPTSDGRFDRKAFKDVLPENNTGVPVIPQLLTKRSEDFLWAAQLLAEHGYREVNLNLGCPSGTVVAKGKGSGMLADLPALETFLSEIFEKSPIDISIKTRLGLKSETEFPALLELFCRFPIKELTIHTRVREDFYRKPAHMEAFALALERCPFPLCYNGDLVDTAHFQTFTQRFPAFQSEGAVMLGRGLVADPALFRRYQGGPPATREELQAYHDSLFDAYSQAFGSKRNAMSRMKEFWFYHICLFAGGEKLIKALRKTTDADEYRFIAARVYTQLSLRPDGILPTW